jgi:hypothetical protein
MYQLIFHPGLAHRWAGFPPDRKILMIANELNRAKNLLRDAADPVESSRALERAFELLDLTVDTTSGSARYEFLRFREVLGQLYADLTAALPSADRAIMVEDLMKLLKVIIAFDKTSYASLSVS